MGDKYLAMSARYLFNGVIENLHDEHLRKNHAEDFFILNIHRSI